VIPAVVGRALLAGPPQNSWIRPVRRGERAPRRAGCRIATRVEG
jgi:hypothetical protein